MEIPQETKKPMRFRKRWFFGVFFVLFFFGPATYELVAMKWAVSHALAHAKSIRIEHYHEYWETKEGDNKMIPKEDIFASRDLLPVDIPKIEEAFPISPDLSFPGLVSMCSFNPHHRIIITDEAGNLTTIRVCFECDHVAIDYGEDKNGKIEPTPLAWSGTLRRFFANEGMPNSPELYRNNYRVAAPAGQPPATNK